MNNIIPIGDYVLVKRKPPAKTAGGLIIPDSSQEKSMLVDVIAVSDEPGKHWVKVGQTVLLQKYAGHETKFDGEDYIICKVSEILALVNITKESLVEKV